MTDVRQTYRIRSPETWAAARDAFLDGAPAEVVCARFDLGLSAFWKRAREEGWRRSDQPDPVPEHPLPEPDVRLERVDLADLAWQGLSRAIGQGRIAEALRWQKLHAELTVPERTREREAAREDVREEARLRRAGEDAKDARIDAITEVAERLALDPALFHAPRPRRAASRVDDVDEVHSVSTSAPLNRAERRRLARLGRASPPPP